MTYLLDSNVWVALLRGTKPQIIARARESPFPSDPTLAWSKSSRLKFHQFARGSGFGDGVAAVAHVGDV
jgi:predicted nucleic acid-binding protein